MSNIVVIDGDTLKFETLFGPNTVTPIEPCVIHGSGNATVMGKKICVLGDETKVSISALYTKSAYQTPGNGDITITALSIDQQVEFAHSPTSVIVVGSKFIALFTPNSPASDPTLGPDPSPTPTSGSGQFINSQSFVTAG